MSVKHAIAVAVGSWLVAIGIILWSCVGVDLPANTRTLFAAEKTIFDLVVSVWNDLRDEDLPANCVRNLQEVTRLVITEGDTFVYLCGGWCEPGQCPDGPSRECPYGCANGCTITARLGVGHTNDVPVVVLHTSIVRKDRLLVHEFIHVVGRCVGDADMYHRNPELWKHVGGDMTVEAVAKRLL